MDRPVSLSQRITESLVIPSRIFRREFTDKTVDGNIILECFGRQEQVGRSHIRPDRKFSLFFQFFLITGKVFRLRIESIFGTALRLKRPNTIRRTNGTLLIGFFIAGQVDRHLPDTGTFFIIFRIETEVMKGRTIFLSRCRKCTGRRHTVQCVFPDIGRDCLVRIEDDGGLRLHRIPGSDTGLRFHHETDIPFSVMLLLVIDRQETFVRFQRRQIRFRIDTAEQPKSLPLLHIDTRHHIHINIQ